MYQILILEGVSPGLIVLTIPQQMYGLFACCCLNFQMESAEMKAGGSQLPLTFSFCLWKHQRWDDPDRLRTVYIMVSSGRFSGQPGPCLEVTRGFLNMLQSPVSPCRLHWEMKSMRQWSLWVEGVTVAHALLGFNPVWFMLMIFWGACFSSLGSKRLLDFFHDHCFWSFLLGVP